MAPGWEGADFGGGFEAGTGGGQVDAFSEVAEALFDGGLAGELAQAKGIRLGHVKEAQAGGGDGGEAGLVGAGERVPAHEVDVIGEKDELADAVTVLNAAGGVGEDDGADAEGAEHAHGEGDLGGGVALVGMDAALHDEDGFAAQRAGDDAAGVAFDGGLGEVGDVGVGDEDGIGDGVGDCAQAGAEDDAEARGGCADPAAPGRQPCCSNNSAGNNPPGMDALGAEQFDNVLAEATQSYAGQTQIGPGCRYSEDVACLGV